MDQKVMVAIEEEIKGSSEGKFKESVELGDDIGFFIVGDKNVMSYFVPTFDLVNFQVDSGLEVSYFGRISLR